MEQKILIGANSVCEIPSILEENGIKKPLLVCGKSFDKLALAGEMEKMRINRVRFSDYGPNPRLEDIINGVALFNKEGCDGIIAVGGGSTIDAAKCIKLYCRMDAGRNYLEQEKTDTGVTVIAIPTTAGTGAESTANAVIYYKGVKQSVVHPSILPDYALLIPSVLDALPEYQKKVTLADAMCQAIETWWSKKATEESVAYSKQAVELIRDNWRDYMDRTPGRYEAAAQAVLLGANLSGRAIRICATTAPHAMSYTLNKLYSFPHGHSVAVSMTAFWEMVDASPERPRERMDEIEKVFSVEDYKEMLAELKIERPVSKNRAADVETLTSTVIMSKLASSPVTPDTDAIRAMYEKIVLPEE